jgi:ribulose-phosphate 3-epimerase
MSHLVMPSILSADFGNLQAVCEMINESKADGFHLDIMDGVFVPNISFGFPIVKVVQKYAKKPLDVHLMIIEPDRYIERFRDAGATTLTIHYEENMHLHRSVDLINKLGMKVCIAINPKTPIILLENILSDIESVCIMSVEPGFGGQSFIENTYNKVNQLKEMIQTKKLNTFIKIDGGVNLNNYERLVHAGTDIFVAGSSVFDSEDPITTIDKLKNVNNN